MQIYLNRESGFTLIELMIVVAIIGIIAAIAYPTYQNHVQDTRRATAQSDLMELAQFMERRYTSNYSYSDDGDDPDLPFDHSPQDNDENNAFYNIGFEDDVTENAFTLEAVPTGAQSDDRCGTLTLNNQGERGADADDCW